ncbi:hypothetical protein JDS87_23815 [Bacillus cereus]|uniref:hypothetical protein n=1 Tax=Bacillus cereus TaxID=1396 RepID=UPI0018F6AB05|nr:hypothetical protein [Bacillus cereus]MBJ8054893.1 hypothetical protein [Bacillus cereus]
MNNQEVASREIVEFLKSDTEKVMLIKGTNYFKKHALVLEIINENKSLKRGLFRSDTLERVSVFFKDADLEIPNGAGKPAGNTLLVENTVFSFDSFNKSTWKKTPSELDFALIYQIELFNRKTNELKDDFINNILKEKSIDKIFIVSNLEDHGDYEWLSGCVNRTIEFNR